MVGIFVVELLLLAAFVRVLAVGGRRDAIVWRRAEFCVIADVGYAVAIKIN